MDEEVNADHTRGRAPDGIETRTVGGDARGTGALPPGPSRRSPVPSGSAPLKVALVAILSIFSSISYAENVWVGRNTDWHDGLNWTLGSVPTAHDKLDVRIPGQASHFPELTDEAVVCGRLDLDEGARIDISGDGSLALGVSPLPRGRFDAAMRIRRTITSEQFPDLVSNPPPPFVLGTITVATNTIGPPLPEGLALRDIAPKADISTSPYIVQARQLVDDDPLLRTQSGTERGTPQRTTRVDFRFDKPRSIATVMWSVPQGGWAILADTTGDGEYETLLRADFYGVIVQPPGDIWTSRTWVRNDFWPAVEGVHGIRFVTLYKRAYLFGVQILEPCGSLEPASAEPSPAVPALAAGEAVEVPAPPVSEQYRKGFHAEPWMFVSGWISAPKKNRKPLAQQRFFMNFVKAVKDLRANTVNIWPLKTFCTTCGAGTYEYDVLWPSRYDRWPIRVYGKPKKRTKVTINEEDLSLGEGFASEPGDLLTLDEAPEPVAKPAPAVGEDALKEIVSAFHTNELTVFTMERCPYPRALKDFPETETRDKPAPYVGRHAREFLKGFVLEQVERGVDGVGIGYDEQLHFVANPGRVNQVTKDAFRERFGIDPPAKAGDTEAYRKWIVFAYEQFAYYLGEAAAAAKKANPKVATKTPTGVSGGNMHNDRIGIGIAEDIVGEISGIDYFRAYVYQDSADLGHYVTAYTTLYCLGANRDRGPDTLHNCAWADNREECPGYYLEATPVYISGPPVSSIMHGGRMPLFWRHNYIYYGGYDKYALEAFTILDVLAAWGSRSATIPKEILLLKSRTSEDWWQLRQRFAPDGDPVDQTRGFLYDKWLNDLLLSNGYPYRTCYLEHPDVFGGHAMAAKVILLPFPYSVSDEAVEALGAAAAKGAKIVLYGAKGETDEWGRKRPAPAFAPMIADGRAVYVADDIVTVGLHGKIRAKTLAQIDSLLGPDKPTFLEAHGKDVELTMLEKGERERYLCLINWVAGDVVVDAGVNLPDGSYRVMLYDKNGTSRATIGGSEKPDATALRRFRIGLAPWEIKVLYIAPDGAVTEEGEKTVPAGPAAVAGGQGGA